MTYKERYYRDHKNDKKPLSTRLIEIVVDTLTGLAFIAMVCLLGTDWGDHPIPWLISYAAAVFTFIGCKSYRERYEDEEDE